MTYLQTNTALSTFFVTIFRIFLLICLPTCLLQAQVKPAELVAQTKWTHSFRTVSLFQKNTNALENVQNLPTALQNYELLEIPLGQVEVLEKQAPEAMQLDIPFSTETIALELVQVDIFPNGYEVQEMPSGNAVRLEAKGLHYRGIIKGQSTSIAAVSIINGEIFGLISATSMGNMVLGKIESQDAYILYNDADIADQFSYTCTSDTRAVSTAGAMATTESGAAQCAGIWLDVGNDIVLDKGGVEEATAYVEALFAQVAAIYANEDINLYISGMRVWNDQEPFANLGDYKHYCSENGWSGSLAHYVNYAHGGGLAWVDGLCSDEFGYGISGITPTFGTAPTYCWSVYVIAHELGHGFGSPHTHDCTWNGNDTPIDVCGFTSCEGVMPQEGGTIMSYCYMNTVGVNMSLGFGEQPGNLIRTRLAASECVEMCSSNNQTLSTGQGNALPAADVTVFPNPASHSLNIQLEKFKTSNLQITLMDAKSRTVRSQSVLGLSAIKMNVEELARGLYFLKIRAENGKQLVQKVVLR